ncbi:MAG: YdeI/OmpD-associated family protein [Pseudonocardiales bacterium]
MTAEQFAGTLEAGPGGGAVVLLPGDVLKSLGGGSRFRVIGTLNGTPFASSTMSMGAGRVCLGMHKVTRETAGVAIGETVQVSVERDDSPRVLVIPADLGAALAADPAAAAAFERQSFTHRREWVESITSAKREETRARRLAQTLERLRA